MRETRETKSNRILMQPVYANNIVINSWRLPKLSTKNDKEINQI